MIIPSPYWVSFPDQVQFAGGKPVFAQTDPANDFRPTLRDIEAVATERTRGVIINSPCNPTGAVIRESELAKIVEWCASRDAFLVFDETYEFFVYDGAQHVSAMRWFERVSGDGHRRELDVEDVRHDRLAPRLRRRASARSSPPLGKIQSHSGSLLGEHIEVHHALPVGCAVDDDSNFLGKFFGLRESKNLKHLVKCSEAPGKDDKSLREVDKPILTHEEVMEVEVERRCDVGIG